MTEPNITKSPIPNPDLLTLAENLTTTGPHKIESTPRRVRALFSGQFIFDTTHAKHVWEHKYFPHFYVPLSSISPGLLATSTSPSSSFSTGILTIPSSQRTTDRILVFEKGSESLEGLVRFEFKAMDAWFEEDVQIYDHPKNPYTRIDILSSSRKIEVRMEGVAIAESRNSMFLFETGLRTRFYLPKTAVKQEYLTASDTRTKCPYKGEAQYYHVTIGEKVFRDVVWWYEYPTTESAAIQGMVCFYNEKVDTYVDGVLEEK